MKKAREQTQLYAMKKDSLKRNREEEEVEITDKKQNVSYVKEETKEDESSEGSSEATWSDCFCL